MIKKSAWFNLLCGLSSVSFIAASCQKMQAPATKSAEEIFRTLTKGDITIAFNKNQDKTKILPSAINEKNYFNYFYFQISQSVDQKELDHINFDAKNFVPNNQSGTLSFDLDVSVVNRPKDIKNFDFRIDGLMTGSGASSGNGSSSASNGSGSGNSGSTTTQPEHDPNDCPTDTSKTNKASSSEATVNTTRPTESQSQPRDSSVPPSFPNGFPGFPGSNITKKFVQKQNSYPDYVASRYKTVDKQLIYKEIWDRTFSIRPGTFTSDNGTAHPIVDQGTGWVLDYAKNSSNNNQLKLFIATNLHVIGNYGNTNSEELDDLLSYSDPTGVKPSGFALGKSNKTPSFTPQPNNQSVDQLKQNAGTMLYYSYKEGGGKIGIEEVKTTEAFSTPKIVFAAVDYLDDHALNQYKSKIDEKWKEWKAKTLSSINGSNSSDGTVFADEEKARLKKLTEYNGKISFYTDFGILELDVDLSKADEKLKEWINNSTKAVDSYVNRYKTTQHLPNYNPETGNYFPTLDYISKNLGLASCKPSYAYGIDNAKDIYIAGYPKDLQSQTFWMQNNPAERYQDITQGSVNNQLRIPQQAWLPNKDLFNVPSYTRSTDSATSKTWSDINNIQIYTKLWNRPFIDRYGFNYFTKFSSLYYGASGSVAYNDFGQIVGIYDGVASSTNFGDVSNLGTFAPLVQAANIKVQSDENITNYAYNLIDNKGFPHQTRSYRSNLSLFYPNGFTWPSTSATPTQSNSKVTAIFPNGF